jgi:hypothetical protein
MSDMGVICEGNRFGNRFRLRLIGSAFCLRQAARLYCAVVSNALPFC